ncbi:unnamed protein product [Didymodactylos carnosus]|uniref:Uncharacterized protein n=1 Tax=Didymodactylos carnosus TaxID=1234261 RepID=A0A8S2EUF0_9BILA|nr:unnamed protein product [Didymodactylos carnosus]CAF4051480.1 unnamed protein product [Didymodactylos carnosus]
MPRPPLAERKKKLYIEMRRRRRQVMRSRFRRSGLNIEALYASIKTVQQTTTIAGHMKEEEANSYGSNELREELH